MKKLNPIIILILIVGVIWAVTQSGFFGAITGSERMQRSGPSAAGVGETFEITYTAQSTTGSWGATIEDIVSGGCTFANGGTTNNVVMISDQGDTLTLTINAPSSPGTCSFGGDYQFGDASIHNFNTLYVQISDSCIPSCDCAATTCTGSTCSDGCGGTCQGTRDCTVPCTMEILISQGQISRGDLGLAIQSWSGG